MIIHCNVPISIVISIVWETLCSLSLSLRFSTTISSCSHTSLWDEGPFVLFAPDLLIHISKWFPVVYFSPFVPMPAELALTKRSETKTWLFHFSTASSVCITSSPFIYIPFLLPPTALVCIYCVLITERALWFICLALSFFCARRSPRRLPFDSNGIWQWLAVYFVCEWVVVCVCNMCMA